MTSRTTAGAFASLLSLALLTGCGDGKSGSVGPAGPVGPTGPLGPAAEPPRVDSVSPRFISGASTVRIRGAHFSPNAADNVVFANGTIGTVISATDTEIWATGLDAGAALTADISVRSFGNISNPFTVRAGKSGDVEFIEPIAPQSPRSLAFDVEEAWLYVGDDNDGVYRIAVEGGKIEKIASLSGRSQNLVKRGPGGNIYLASRDTDGVDRVERLEADGTVTVISQNQVNDVTQMTWDPTGSLYLADSNGDVYRRTADGQTFGYYGITDDFGQSPAGLEWMGGNLCIVHSSGNVEVYDASGATASYLTNLNSVSNPKAATTDGATLFVLTDTSDAAIVRVNGANNVAVASGNQQVTGVDVGYSSLVQTAGGEFFFADPFNEERIVASTKEGILRSWYENPTNNYDDLVELGGDYYYSFAGACYDAMSGGGTMLRVSVDGAVSRFAENVCGENLVTYGGSIVVLDVRGELNAITTTGVASLLSNDSSLFGTYALGVDGDGNLYAGFYDAALAEGRVVKISADGATVDPAFVTGLDNSPSSFAVIGTDLYFSDYYQLMKVPTATGGTGAIAIPYGVGFEYIFGVSEGRNGDVLFLGAYLGFSQYAEFALRPDGNVEYASDLAGFDGIGIDSFNNYYTVDGDIAVELP